jgi:type VI secretion system secreted protein Hcp
VKGEATATGLKDYMEIMSFSFGASNPTTIGPGGGGSGGGRVSVSSFNIMKMSETASADLFEKCCLGEHYPTAKIILRKSGGTAATQANFLEYSFEQVFVDSIQWSGSGGGDDTPTESVSLAFSKVEIEYSAQDTLKGTLGVVGQASWDVAAVKK